MKKQTELPIDEIKINRICQFGTCKEDMAFVINGVDLCFEHGRNERDRLFRDSQVKSVTYTGTNQMDFNV